VVKAAVSSNLPRSVLLDTDVEEFPLILGNSKEYSFMVTTQVQSKLKDQKRDGKTGERWARCTVGDPPYEP